MSVGGSLSGISFAGLGSGIDTQTIVSQLMQIERIPVNRMRANQARLEARLTIYQQLSSKVAALKTAASGLNSASNFSPITATVSDTAVASVSAGNEAAAGTFALSVTKLARATKALSAQQTSSTEALNLSGEIVVNGKAVTIAATDTLSQVASKINGIGSGVTASIIGGSGSAYLSLTGNETGAANKIQLADATGSVLSSLGLVSGSATLRDPLSGGFRSYGLANSTDTLGKLTNLSKVGSFQIGTETINVDFATDTLSSVASKINAQLGGQGVTASVVETKDGGRTVKKLEVTGLGSNSVTDTDGLLQDLGVYQKAFGNEVVAARDSEFTIDGISRTSYTNAVTDAIQGVTVTLLKEDVAGAKATIDLKRDNEKIKSSFKGFKDAFNELVEFVKSASSFDTKSFESGPLFGDIAANSVISMVQDTIFQNSNPGGTFRNLADLGFGLDSDGKLTFDEAGLDKAMATDIESVKKVMLSSGSSTNTDLVYLGSTARTSDSGTAGFDVKITRLATKSRTTASAAQTLANRGGEVLTFNGPLFSTPIEFNVTAGDTLAQTVDKINADSRLKDNLVASIDGGKLKIEAKRFGASLDFSVSSNLASDPDTTGIGLGTEDHTKGLDVAGEINGEEAVGSGQFLTGKDTNAKTAGLQLQYTGTVLGTIGNVKYQRGMSNRILGVAENISDPINGMLTSTTKSIESQVSDIGDRIESYNETLALREQSLRAKFLAMERVISQLQSQQSQIAGFAQQNNNNN